MLDTGANLTVLKDEAIQQTDLDMAQAEPLILHTANGEVAAQRVLLEAFSVAAITNKQMPAAILPTHVLSPGIDGLLGTDWLGQFDFFY